MKKFLFSLFILTVIIYLFIFRNNNCFNKKAKIYQINSKNYCLLSASNQEQWERGLMFYKKPINFDGMIFIFPKKELRSFWNENTYLDLDVYWLSDDRIVGKSFLPSIKKDKEIITIESSKPVNKVVELFVRN